ncbi:MAG: DUF4234 domain-containing protein [Clostridia bacterium]|nr:DUF4234 domain-containing protein [Clostridia bacterium]
MRRVKTDRSLLIYILLSIVTCGIYNWIFIHELASDVNEMCREDGKTTQGLLMFLLLSLVTCGFYAIYWWYAVSERVGVAAARRGLNHLNFNGGTFLLWYLVGALVCGIGTFVAYYKLFDVCNQVGNHYNQFGPGGMPPFGAVPPYGQM